MSIRYSGIQTILHQSDQWFSRGRRIQTDFNLINKIMLNIRNK